MAVQDVRWIQGFQNYKKALIQLEEAVDLKEQMAPTRLERLGTIHVFKITHELAWKTLKDFLQSRGNVEIYGSEDATREAFSSDLFEDGDVWMEMVQSRNLTSHTYNESIADEIINHVQRSYLPQFVALRNRLERLAEKRG